MTKKINFINLKKYLTRKGIAFEKGFSEHEDDFGNVTEKHDFIILENYNIQIYNDSDCLTMDFGDTGFEHFYSNRKLYSELKNNVVR